MGQKIHPKSMRIGVISTWDSKWFSQGKSYRAFLRQDQEIKRYLAVRLKEAGLGGIELWRTPQSLTIVVAVARPGVIIGRGGQGAESLKEELKKKFFAAGKMNFKVNIVEIKNPSLCSNLVLQEIIGEVEKRMSYRRVMKHAIDRVNKAGAKGVKVLMGGRLDGAEIARRELLSSGSSPLHTLRADIDYAAGTAHTIYGTIGIKVWIFKGEVFEKEKV